MPCENVDEWIYNPGYGQFMTTLRFVEGRLVAIETAIGRSRPLPPEEPSMLVLYGSQGSGSAAAEVALDIAGVDYRKVDAASWQPSPGLEELKRVNPLAQIPTLVLDDGSVLTEVAAILIHLGLVHPQSGLLAGRAVAARAADPRPRLHRRQLLRRHRHPRLSGALVSRPRRRRRRRRCRRAAGPALHELWEIFADQFPATPWLSGDRLGALDILAATVSMWSGARKALAQSRPAFSALLARIEADPRVAAVWARHWPKR